MARGGLISGEWLGGAHNDLMARLFLITILI